MLDVRKNRSIGKGRPVIKLISVRSTLTGLVTPDIILVLDPV